MKFSHCKATPEVIKYVISLTPIHLYQVSSKLEGWVLNKIKQLLINSSDLQNENEVVYGFVSLVEVVFWGFLVLLIILQLLDDIGVL